MTIWILFKQFYEIERKSGSNLTNAIKNSFNQAYTTRNHYYKLMRDFKMTPAFYFSNRYHTRAHDSGYKNLKLRFFKEIKKKQEARGDVNIKQIENIVQIAEKNFVSKAARIKEIIKRVNSRKLKIKKFGFREITNIIEIKRPQSIKENLQEWLLYSARLYHQSLQNLIEGQREVLRDKKFTFEDNKTVEEKMQAFEDYLKSKIPKFKKKFGAVLNNSTVKEEKNNKKEGSN